ncbi:hypothetical protein NKG94_08690 [Micromonospora sp. M12]
MPGGLTGARRRVVAVFFVAGNLLFAAYQVPYLATRPICGSATTNAPG